MKKLLGHAPLFLITAMFSWADNPVMPARDGKSSAPELTYIATTTKIDATSEDVLARVDLDRLLVGYCFGCFSCRKGGHALGGDPPPQGGRVGYHPENCSPGSCSDHPSCGLGDTAQNTASLVTATQAMSRATPAELMAFMARNPRRVRINEARRALQLIGCADQVVASYQAASVPALATLLQ